MRFLVDAQLPPALARLLSEKGHIAEHVADVGLLTASDAAICRFAAANNAVVVTKDEDFPMQRLSGRHDATIVWLRVGNCSSAELIRWFLPLLSRIEALIAAGEGVIEVH